MFGRRPEAAIGRLKAGGNVVVGAHLFSVGREVWLRGAEQVLKDLETTGDAFVRFIRGDYGVGKTNFAARLFHQALERGWAVSYVEIGDAAPMHEFALVLASNATDAGLSMDQFREIVRRCLAEIHQRCARGD